MKRDAKTVAGWNFERIIPCHGVRLRYIKMLNHHVYFFSFVTHAGCHRDERATSLEGCL
jgi:hypothetical protein